MADDSMEIASDIDYDRDVADDYLDLDIDLTTGRPDDENFVLGDVATKADSGEYHTLQPPLIGADHVMLDEENQDLVYDDDLLREGQEHDMEDEAPSHSFVTVNEPYSEYHEIEDTSDAVEGDFTDPVDLMWENEESSALEALGSNVQLQDNENLQYEAVEDLNGPRNENEVEDSNGLQNENKTEEHTEAAINRESRTNSPRQNSDEHLVVEEFGSPSTSNRHQTASRHGSVAPLNPDENDYEAFNEQDELHDNDGSSHPTVLPATENILVIYQGAEYALFGSPDLDSPDSFFLSDQLIAHKPISDFFKGVRDVIHEDLSEEDELCVVVKHFGLEIEETVCSLHDVTISQILELHEKLLSNEEHESRRPLCIELTTRPSFARRFANLVAGAAEGKGLSQLVVLGEPSEEYNNSGDGTEDSEHFVVPGKDEYADEGLEIDAEDQVTDLVAEGDEVHYSIEQAGDQDEDKPQYEGYPQDSQPGVDPSTHADLDKPAQHGDAWGTNKQSKKRYSSSDGLDEDGDLIDYSEDELESAPVSALTDKKKNEYEAINEDLRRRSLSRAAEGLQQPREQTPTSQELEAHLKEPLSEVEPELQDEAGNGDVADVEDWDHAADEGSHEYLEDRDTDAIDGLETNDYLDLSVDVVGPDDDKPTDISSFTELGANADAERDKTEGKDHEQLELEYEIDYNLGDDPRSPSQVRNVDKPNDIAASNSGASRNEDIINSFGTEPEAAENANSSATLSVNNGHDDDGLEFYEDDSLNPPATTEDQEILFGADGNDEIDYDDDDYGQDLAAPSKPELSVLSAITNGGSGKRSWQDSDDGTDVTDKDAKRARS